MEKSFHCRNMEHHLNLLSNINEVTPNCTNKHECDPIVLSNIKNQLHNIRTCNAASLRLRTLENRRSKEAAGDARNPGEDPNAYRLDIVGVPRSFEYCLDEI